MNKNEAAAAWPTSLASAPLSREDHLKQIALTNCNALYVVPRGEGRRKSTGNDASILSQCNASLLKAKETKKCLHRDVDDDDLVDFFQL
jgi:hypothetical protein